MESFIEKDFPEAGRILISGSENSSNELLNVRKPEKPERIMNNANDPITTPNEAIIVMILMALFPLFANKYLLAM